MNIHLATQITQQMQSIKPHFFYHLSSSGLASLAARLLGPLGADWSLPCSTAGTL